MGIRDSLNLRSYNYIPFSYSFSILLGWHYVIKPSLGFNRHMVISWERILMAPTCRLIAHSLSYLLYYLNYKMSQDLFLWCQHSSSLSFPSITCVLTLQTI